MECLSESVPIRQNSCISLVMTSQGCVSVLLMHGRHPANTRERAGMPGSGHLSLVTSGNERSGCLKGFLSNNMNVQWGERLFCLGLSIFSNRCDASLLAFHGSQSLYNLMRMRAALADLWRASQGGIGHSAYRSKLDVCLWVSKALSLLYHASPHQEHSNRQLLLKPIK